MWAVCLARKKPKPFQGYIPTLACGWHMLVHATLLSKAHRKRDFFSKTFSFKKVKKKFYTCNN